MKIAFHLHGHRWQDFARSLGGTHTIFGETLPKSGTPHTHGLILDAPDEDVSLPILYRSNRIDKPKSCPYVVYYGDVRKRVHPGTVPVVCDIMDSSFWHYYEGLKRYGLFTFSVDTSLCELDVCVSTLRVLRAECDVISYRGVV